VREIGRQLNVSAVLMGSVRRSKERLRVLAQLVETSGGQYLWSETYDRRMEDLFAIQEEISAAIVKTLRIRLMDQRQAPAMRRGANNLEAYNMFLKGRFHRNKRTADGLHRALEYTQQSIAIDPSFAPAQVGVADSYILLAEYGLMSPESSIPQARSAALRAIEIDPALGEAHASLGLIRSIYDWEWDDGERHYRQAIQLNPGYATARHWFAVDYLAMLGRFEEALEEIEVAQELDPLSSIIREGKGYILMITNRHQEALEEYRRVLEFDSYFYKAYTSMGRAYTQMGRYDEAIAMLLKGRLLSGDIPSILGALGQTYGLAGRIGDARGVLEELTQLARSRCVPATCLALNHLGLGECDRALELLEDGARHHEALAALKVHPAYDPLRGEPRFKALLRNLGFGRQAVREAS
jgi:tetratricopeptide (TPR) repeat protein